MQDRNEGLDWYIFNKHVVGQLVYAYFLSGMLLIAVSVGAPGLKYPCWHFRINNCGFVWVCVS